jgi:hypothetical protein
MCLETFPSQNWRKDQKHSFKGLDISLSGDLSQLDKNDKLTLGLSYYSLIRQCLIKNFWYILTQTLALSAIYCTLQEAFPEQTNYAKLVALYALTLI